MTRATQIRVLFLLLVLLALVILAYWQRDHRPEWNDSLVVGIYPHNGDGSTQASRHIEALDDSDFDTIEDWLSAQAGNADLGLEQPFDFRRGRTLTHAPPLPPEDGGFLGQLKWGIGLRWWHWRFDTGQLDPDIVLVLRYSALEGQRLDLHSIGMSSPRLGLVSLSTSEQLEGVNRVMIAHELLHTVGASDLYNPATGLPAFPAGFANPDKEPLFPQQKAELMAGRIPVSRDTATQATALAQCQIGDQTARQIGWLR